MRDKITIVIIEIETGWLVSLWINQSAVVDAHFQSAFETQNECLAWVQKKLESGV